MLLFKPSKSGRDKKNRGKVITALPMANPQTSEFGDFGFFSFLGFRGQEKVKGSCKCSCSTGFGMASKHVLRLTGLHLDSDLYLVCSVEGFSSEFGDL